MAFPAALVLILSLAISVFTQQAILAVPCNRIVVGANASIPIGNTTARLPYMRTDVSLWDADPVVKNSIINGFADPTASRSVSVKGCTTGNCSFDSVNGITYSFSGTCSKCFDTSSEITVGPYDNTSGGVWVKAKGGSPSILISDNPDLVLQSFAGSPEDELLIDLPSDPDIQSIGQSAFVNVSILTATLNGCTISSIKTPGINCSQFSSYANATIDQNGATTLLEQFNAVSMTCLIYPCARNSFAEVRNGIFTEKTINEVLLWPQQEANDPVPSLWNPFHGYAGVNEPCIIDGVQYDGSNYTEIPSWGEQIQSNLSGQLVPTDCAYSMDGYSATAISGFVAPLLGGNCSTTTEVDLSLYADKWAICTSGSADAFWLQSLYNGGNATFASISAAMESMVTAISDSFRLQGSYGSIYDAYLGAPPIYGNPNLPTVVYGSVYQIDVCVQINWGWLALPSVLLILTALLLFGTIVSGLHDRQMYPIWKSSILPLLYATPGTELVTHSSSLAGLSKDAQIRAIQLIRDEDRWGFVQTQNLEDARKGQ